VAGVGGMSMAEGWEESLKECCRRCTPEDDTEEEDNLLEFGRDLWKTGTPSSWEWMRSAPCLPLDGTLIKHEALLRPTSFAKKLLSTPSTTTLTGS
jgi:hypothetical protein